MKVLVFDIWADFGHFRKFYTTSSPLTFSVPPPSTIAGILGAIYGTGKKEYLKLFAPDKCRLGIRIVNPVKKIRIGINLINTKGNYWIPYGNKYHEPRTQIRTELLKDPCFRIYFTHTDERILEEMTHLLKEHKCVYSVSLGLSELLANFGYIGLFDGEEKSLEEAVEVSTPVTSENLTTEGLVIETGKKYFKERMPLVMNPERIIEKYDEVIFEPEGRTIKAKLSSHVRLENGENIAFF